MTACCSSASSKVRKGAVSLAVASALCAAAFVGGPNTASLRPRVDPALLFPAGTVMTISLDGGPCTEFGRELALSKIWHEPEVQEFTKSATDFAHEFLESNAKTFAEQLGLKPEELHQLVRSKISI